METKKQNRYYKADLEITAWERCCWICGTTEAKMTTHHTLPRHLKPKKNFLCPICESCHHKLNKNDITGLVSFAYKIDKTIREVRRMTGDMVSYMKQRGKNESRNKKTR